VSHDSGRLVLEQLQTESTSEQLEICVLLARQQQVVEDLKTELEYLDTSTAEFQATMESNVRAASQAEVLISTCIFMHCEIRSHIMGLIQLSKDSSLLSPHH
jgi:hypothetical protein